MSIRSRQAQAAATSFLALFSIVGLALYGLPLYYDFMVREFGWSRTQVTSGNALSKLVVGPLFGFWRAGSSTASARAGSCSSASSRRSGAHRAWRDVRLWMFYAFYLLNAIGYVCGGPLPNQVLLSQWFKRTRQGDGFAYLGIGIGGALVPWLSYWMVEWWGGAARCVAWRAHHRAGVAMAYFVKDARPGSTGRRRGGAGARAPLAPLRECSEGRRSTCSRSGACARSPRRGANQHLKLIMSLDAGYAQAEAARIVSLVLAFSIAGRLLMGWLADRMAKKHVMLVIYLLVASAIPLLFFASSRGAMGLFAAVFASASAAST